MLSDVNKRYNAHFIVFSYIVGVQIVNVQFSALLVYSRDGV